jgi:hypothetical protein
MTVFLGHSIKEAEENWLKICVFAVTISFMIVSALGAGPVLRPAYGPIGSYQLAITLDAGDLILLYVLIRHYGRVRIYRQWLRGQGQPSAAAAGQAPAPVWPPAAVVPEPRPGTAGTAGTTRTAEPEPVAGTTPVPAEPAPAPVAGSENHGSGPRPGDGNDSPAPGGRPTDPALREGVTAEIAARPENRPSAESTTRREERGRRILAEFLDRTKEEMNLREFGKALGVSKAVAGEIRRAIAAAPVTGEQPAAEERLA